MAQKRARSSIVPTKSFSLTVSAIENLPSEIFRKEIYRSMARSPIAKKSPRGAQSPLGKGRNREPGRGTQRQQGALKRALAMAGARKTDT